MTDQQINEAIALHLGWLRPEHPDCMKHKIGWSMPEKWWMDPKTVLRFGHDIPNYCTDLNAMALVEAALTGDQRANYYTTHLPDVTCCDLDGWIHLQFPKIVSATARQRAEAFLRTIGKWKEESK